MSMLDFSSEDKQHETSAIPAGSKVLVSMHLRQPEGNLVGSDPWLRLSRDGSCEMLDCEFSVVGGTFEGKKIWEMFVLEGTTEKQQKSRNRNRQVIRAILDAAHGIDPNDNSEPAKRARAVNEFSDFEGMVFPVVVGIKPIQAGDRYVNNSVKKIVTPDDDDYKMLMDGGESISDTPLPLIPSEGGQAPAAGAVAAPAAWAKPKSKPAATQGSLTAGPGKPAPSALSKWTKAKAPAACPPAASEAPAGRQAGPGWVAKKATPPTEAPETDEDLWPASLSEASGMDDVPF